MSEVQHYPRLIIGGLMVLVSSILVVQVVAAVRTHHTPDFFTSAGMVCAVLLIIISIYLVRYRMTTEVNKKRLKLDSVPFHIDKMKIKWRDADSIEIIRLPRNYYWLGWNIHFSTRSHVYNLNGKALVKITMKDGREILLGIRKPTEWKEMLSSYRRTSVLLKSNIC